MKLWDRNAAVVGGRYYVFENDKGDKFQVNGFDSNWNGFVSKVQGKMSNNNVAIPDNLSDLIEDQICQRQPKGKCRLEAGDELAKGIHAFASVADKAMKVLGMTTNLEKKARGCASCNKRRQKINSMVKQ